MTTPIAVDDIVTAYGPLPDLPESLNGSFEVLYGTEGQSADQYFCIYPTGVIVTGVTPCHPLVQAGQSCLEAAGQGEDPIRVELENESYWDVADRGQKARVPKFTDHALCTIYIRDTPYPINHPFNTTLLNFNPRLKTQPDLLLHRSQWEGHIAVLGANRRTIEKMKRRFASVAKYRELRNVPDIKLLS